MNRLSLGFVLWWAAISWMKGQNSGLGIQRSSLVKLSRKD